MHRLAYCRSTKVALYLATTLACSSCGQDEDATPGGTPTGGTGGMGDAVVPDDSGTPPGPLTNYPGRSWSVPEPTYSTVIEADVEITMSDGVVLIGDVSYPTDLATGARATGEFPVLLTQNPYGAVFSAASGEIFVTHGYIYASIDVRGTSRSGGVHDLFSPREADDGAALVTWAAALEGSDGRVGLHGCSQLGINQLETATLLGPDSPVKAMIPACASGDFYRDTAFDNGIASTVGALFAGTDMTTGGDLVYYRDFWIERDRLARAPAIASADIPMLLWSGWHEPGTIGSLELYVALQNLAAGRPMSAPIVEGDAVSGRVQVILGDWAHAGGLDQGIQLQWYDTWIKGVDTGLPTNTTTPLHLAELGGTERWLNASSYPLVEAYTPFFLSSDGGLSQSADAAASQDTLSWVPDGSPGGSIEYETEPFADGGMLAGPIAARLEVTSSNGNVQLSVDVFDQAADGSRAKVTHGSILGSLRRTDAGASWMDENGLPARPYLTLDQDEPLTPGERTRLEVPLWPTVWSIDPGHSIVVRIATQAATADCGQVIALPVGCDLTDPQTASLNGGVYTLERGGPEGSLISLPLLDHGALTTAEAAVSPTGELPDPPPLGAVEYPLPVEW